MVSKKKEKKNEAFKKVKLKVGKKLKKTTTTDSTVTTRKLVLGSQLSEKESTEAKPLSFRGLNLDELCKQLGHFSKSVRKDALVGTKQLLSSRPDLICTQLRTIIPSIARLLSENAGDQTMNGHLRALFAVICTTSEKSMSPHFPLLVAHVLRALSHMELSTRVLALSVLSMMITSYPTLCRNDPDIFTAFIKLLASPRKPSWNAPRFLESISSFLSIFDSSNDSNFVCIKTNVNMGTGKHDKAADLTINALKGSPFDFPVTTPSVTSSVSPFELPESLITLSTALEPIITTSIVEDKAGAFLTPTVKILQAVSNAVINQPNSFLITDFREQIRKIWAKTVKAVEKRKTSKLQLAISGLL